MTKTIIEKVVKGLSLEDEIIGLVVAKNTARLIFDRLENKCMFKSDDDLCVDKVFYEELKKECWLE